MVTPPLTKSEQRNHYIRRAAPILCGLFDRKGIPCVNITAQMDALLQQAGYSGTDFADLFKVDGIHFSPAGKVWAANAHYPLAAADPEATGNRLNRFVRRPSRQFSAAPTI